MQVECQPAVLRAQAFAALGNAENVMLSSKRGSLLNSEGLQAAFSLTNGLTASRCWVNSLYTIGTGHAACLCGNCLETELRQKP